MHDISRGSAACTALSSATASSCACRCFRFARIARIDCVECTCGQTAKALRPPRRQHGARPSVPFLLPQLSGVAATVPHDTGMGKGTRAGADTAWLNLLTCLIDSTEARDMTERSEACDAVSHFSSAFITAAACASGVWMFRFFSVSGATPAVRPHSHHARRSHAADSERLIGFRLALERIWADGV